MPESPWDGTGLEVLHDADFSGVRLNRSGRYIVCFSAAWCPITRHFMPSFIEEKGKVEGTLAIADITDNDSPLWDVFEIRITPSILVFQDGEVQSRIDGKRFVGIRSSSLTALEAPRHP